jgi:hypothetical protein
VPILAQAKHLCQLAKPQLGLYAAGNSEWRKEFVGSQEGTLRKAISAGLTKARKSRINFGWP